MSPASFLQSRGPVWSGRLPVTEKTASSNLVGTAKFVRTSVGDAAIIPNHSIAEGEMSSTVEQESRRVMARRKGEGPNGLIGRFRVLLPRLKWFSKSKGYVPPQVTPDEMLKIWESQKGFCVACGGMMTLQGVNGSCFDHCHKTGTPRGF